MAPTEIRAEMDRLAGQIMRSMADDRPFEEREPLWMERESLRAQLAEMEVTV